jgi:hypothetical protein
MAADALCILSHELRRRNTNLRVLSTIPAMHLGVHVETRMHT